MDKELELTEQSWKPEDITTVEQRNKDTFAQPRKKLQLQPISVPLLPFVTKSCAESKKYIIKPKFSRVGTETSYFEVDHLLVKNFPTVTIKGISVIDDSNFDIYLRITNPNMSIWVVKLMKLKESQGKVAESNCHIDHPINDLQINFYNELIGSGDLEISTEMQHVEVKDEDKPYIKTLDKNFILLKLPGRMKKDHNWNTEAVKFGFNILAKFERESTYQVRVPIFVACKKKEGEKEKEL